METAYRIKLFGVLQERIAQEITLEKPLETVACLRAFLDATYPILQKIPYLVAVNRVIAKPEDRLLSGSELALLPPFSGG